MFITNMMLTPKMHRLFHFFFIMAPNCTEQDLQMQMQMWYVYRTGISLQVGDVVHFVHHDVTPADFSEIGSNTEDFSEEGSEEEGDREPFRDITNTLAFHV